MKSSVPSPYLMSTDHTPRHRGAAVLGFVLLVVGLFAAVSIDVPRTTFGLKSDESTYVAAALSAGYDGDLTFEQKDLVRFAGLYHSGPDGIFLKRGKVRHLEFTAAFPFISLTKQPDPNSHRLYFGKSLAYPIAAAPFVRFLGLNGIFVLHVFLFVVTIACAYLFLAAQMSSTSAAAFTSAFFLASVLPVYGVILMPEMLNVALVVVAYFLWLYKEVAPESRLAGRWTDYAAAVTLGICTYSKPLPTAVLVAPLVLLAWMRRDWWKGFALGLTAVVVTGALFGFNAAVSGEFNYQGGDRK